MGPPEPSWWWWCPAKPQLWLPTDGRGGWDGQHRQGLSVNRSWLFWGENAQHQPHLGLQSQPCQLTGPRSWDLGTCHGTTVPVSVTQEFVFPLSRVVGSKVRSSGVSRTLDGRGGCRAFGLLRACPGCPQRCTAPTRGFNRGAWLLPCDRAGADLQTHAGSGRSSALCRC